MPAYSSEGGMRSFGFSLVPLLVAHANELIEEL
jgi:hypothetical protein